MTVTMTTPATTTTFTVTPDSNIVHEMTTYVLTFTLAVPHSANDYFFLNVPSTMEIDAGLSCAANSGISSASCSL